MKNLFKLIFLVLLTLWNKDAKAQQDPQYTQYMYNMSVINPAYAGSNEATSLGLLGRSQWVGIDGAPNTFTAFIHSPIGKNVGLGFSLVHDKVGPVTETFAFVDFSYTIKITENSNLAFGIKAGAAFQQIGLLQLNQVDIGDVSFNQNVNNTHPNFGAGAFYYTDRFYIGVAVPSLLETLHFEKSNRVITKASDDKHFFINSGYVFDLNKDFKLKPSFLAKYAKQSPLSLDLSANILWQDKLEFGLSHRLDDSWSALFNLRVNNNLRIGYAYDHTTSNLGTFNSGSHELLLLFDFVFVNSNIKSPRFF
ncbi:MAG: type IX secretion system membrane protein PorP/SprF [Polaribacter sp.]